MEEVIHKNIGRAIKYETKKSKGREGDYSEMTCAEANKKWNKTDSLIIFNLNSSWKENSIGGKKWNNNKTRDGGLLRVKNYRLRTEDIKEYFERSIRSRRDREEVQPQCLMVNYSRKRKEEREKKKKTWPQKASSNFDCENHGRLFLRVLKKSRGEGKRKELEAEGEGQKHRQSES